MAIVPFRSTHAASKSSAAAAKKQKPKDNGQDGIVKVDGAAVYEAQNFDAPVLEYLDSGKEVKISKKIYPGIGGLGSFYKIRLRQGVFGYIADTDVTAKRKSADGEVVATPAKENSKIGDGDEVTKINDRYDDEPDQEENRNTFYYQRYMGLSYYTLNYAEKLKSNVYNANTSVFGLKKTGPTSFLAGLPIDLDLLFTTTAPSFYNKIASKTSGMLIFADAVPFFPFAEGKRYNFFYGFGLLIKYSRWAVSLLNQPGKAAVDSEELTLGVEGVLGASFKLTQKLALRLDGRYFFERQKYFGMGASIEYHY